MNPGPRHLRPGLPMDRRDSLVSDFKEKWGVSPDEAQSVIKNPILQKMLAHLDHVWMEMLREDDQPEQMYRHQGAARIIGDMARIQSELDEIAEVEKEV